jgi:hypothetical protein
MGPLKETCLKQGGQWHERLGCLIQMKDYTQRIYDTTQKECKENGDSWIPNSSTISLPTGFHNIKACYENSLAEYCTGLNKKYPDVATCLEHEKLPLNKMIQGLNNDLYVYDIFAHQKVPQVFIYEQLKKEFLNKTSGRLLNKGNFKGIIVNQDLSPEMISYIIRAAGDRDFTRTEDPLTLVLQYQKENLEPYHINHMVKILSNNMSALHELCFHFGTTLTKDQISHLIEKNAALKDVTDYCALTSHHIDLFIEKDLNTGIESPEAMKNLLEKGYSLNGDQIRAVLAKPVKSGILVKLFQTQDIDPDVAYYVLENEIKNKKTDDHSANNLIYTIYKTFRLPEPLIQKIIYDNSMSQTFPELLNTQHNSINQKDRRYLVRKTLEDGIFRQIEHPQRYIEKEDIDYLLDALLKKEYGIKQAQLGEYIPAIPASRVYDEFIDYYKQYGRENRHPFLQQLYEHIQLSPDQLDKAIRLGYELDHLISYQRGLESKHVDYAIENKISLDTLYTYPGLTDGQRRKILQYMGVDMDMLIKEVGEEYLTNPLWGSISPKILPAAMRHFTASVKNKIPENPLKELVGRYHIDETPIEKIIRFVEKKKMYLKKGDTKYAHYKDKDGQERKIRLGKLLQKDPLLLYEFNKIRQVGIAPKDSNIEIMISDTPTDMARKATGQNFITCETVGSSHGWPDKSGCGWCDDISANNLIAYIRYKGNPKWIGRAVIRWCIREDDKKPDAVIESYYTAKKEGPDRDIGLKYKNAFLNRIRQILNDNGYSASFGNDSTCVTPYRYTGYVDSGTRSSGYIHYNIDRRPKKVGG